MGCLLMHWGLLQSGVRVQLVKHVRLLVAIRSQDHIDDDVLDDLL